MLLNWIIIVYVLIIPLQNVPIHQVSSFFVWCVFLQLSIDIQAPGIYMGVRTAPYYRSNGNSSRRSPSPDRRSHRRQRRRSSRSRLVDFS